ncbi:MAG TPA: serine/threonine-protein kinase [Polyangia bacterium]
MSDSDKDDNAAVADTMTSGEHPAATPGASPSAPIVIETERYELIELLGRGGMGEVHKAYDPRLGRYVALKVMRQATPEQAARLVSEARAQARVEHAHVCKVYGVGELANKLPFIALQFIEGKTLSAVAKQMTREERIAVIRDVADALHAAHRQGLVHRDVKPSNILVERHETGWHAYVTDFGIAREVDAPGLTKTGVVTGTPLYMAPEQARGQTSKIDRRTDVYGLGATTYELLCGRRPFEGESTLDVIWKLTNEEVVPPRAIDPSIPVDLETIVMKCLEKEPERRYESARALADDLKAWADGEPILARRSSLGYRIVRRARKHKALVSTALALVVAGVVGGIWAAHARAQAAEQARLANEFGQEVERNDSLARISALLPLHDTRKERQIIEARMKELEARIAALGDAAEGPGRYALGRGYLVLERPADARRELERAWRAGYRAPEVSYALGLALGQLYQRALAELPPADDSGAEKERRAALARDLRQPALAYLKGAVGVRSEAPEYVEGLIALHERRWQEALDKARAAEERVGWMYQAHTLEGDIRLMLAKERWVEGGPDEALAELDRAGEAYQRAAGIARSSASALTGDCLRWVMAAEILSEHERSPAAAVDGAMAACGRALQALPGDGELAADEVDAWRRQARYQSTHDGDPIAAWQKAELIGRQGKALAPNNVRLLVAAGYIDRDRASWEEDNGKDPRAAIERAIAAGRAALERDPNAHEAYHLMSDAWLVRGDWEAAHGLDPRASYETTSEMGQRAWALAAQGFKVLNTIGLGYLSRGMWEANNGLDPRAALQQAVTTIDKVVRANPNVDYGYNNLCVTFQTLAEYEIKRGLDASATIARALPSCEKAVVIDPNDASVMQSLACVELDLAVWQRGQGIDPGPELERTRATLRRSFALTRTFELAWFTLGESELVATRWAADHGGAVQASFDAARAAYTRAVTLNDDEADALRGLAELHRVRAEWSAARHHGSDSDVRDGLDFATRALKINPRHATAALETGALHLVAARAASGEARRRAAEEAQHWLHDALGFDGNLEREARPLVAEADKLARTSPQ